MQGACNDVVDWFRPKYVFGYYTSTTLVTTKRQIPMRLPRVGIGVLVLLLLLKGGAAASATSVAGAGAAVTYETPTDYAKAHLPRFATMPWAAPVFDQRATTADPQLYCMSSQAGRDGEGRHTDGSCTCMTEQGTAYDISQPECRTIARYGGVYNPYKVQRDFQPSMSGSPVAPPVVQAPSSASGGALIEVGERPMSTFPESAQNRYSGG